MNRAEPLSPAAARAPGGLLAASLIVRNEAAHLPACLQSITGVVDDIVVVDTGSTDDSPAIAAAYGARVFRYPWPRTPTPAPSGAPGKTEFTVKRQLALALKRRASASPATQTVLRQAVVRQAVAGQTAAGGKAV